MQKGFELVDCKMVDSSGMPCPIQVFTNPAQEEKRYLVEELKVDEHTFNSALDPDEFPRLEFEPNHVAVIFKMPKNYSGSEQLKFSVASTGAFLLCSGPRVEGAFLSGVALAERLLASYQ